MVNPQFPLEPQEVKIKEINYTPTAARQQLLEALDHLVSAEEQFQKKNGYFTRLFSKLNYTIPAALLQHYSISVEDASDHHLLIVAQSEKDGKTNDYLVIDQDYQIRSNFPLPAPKIDFLRTVALKHMSQLNNRSPAQVEKERGVYRGYFRYETRTQDRSQYLIAIGIKPPVTGLELTADPTDETFESKKILSELISRFPQPQVHTGQKSRTLAGELEIEPIPTSPMTKN